jgi:hypothetical protein
MHLLVWNWTGLNWFLVNLVSEPMSSRLGRFGFLCFSKMKLNQNNRFGSDPLIGLQRFYFHEVFTAVIFFPIYFLLLFFQSHVTLDVINYHHTPYIKEKTITWFSYTHFNSNKADNN